MDSQKFWDWINSLNPIEVSVDENGDICEEDLEKISQRIADEVKEIREPQPDQ